MKEEQPSSPVTAAAEQPAATADEEEKKPAVDALEKPAAETEEENDKTTVIKTENVEETVDDTADTKSDVNKTVELETSAENSLSVNAAAANASIKINIKQAPPPRVERLESVLSSVSDDAPSASAESAPSASAEFDEDAVRQWKDEEEEGVFKPKLRNARLTEMPLSTKGQELSGLCSIM